MLLAGCEITLTPSPHLVLRDASPEQGLATGRKVSLPAGSSARFGGPRIGFYTGIHMTLPLWARTTSFAVALLALSSASLVAQQAPGAGAATDITVGGITKPSVHAKLALPQFGQVLELPVKEGDSVKKGGALLRQDDRQEVALREALRLEAESTVRIEAAEADLKIKQVQHKRLQDLAAN